MPAILSNNSERIVSEALSWLGTPYHHGADVKGPRGGVDCAMLLVRVFVDTGIVAPLDPRPYPAQFHLHRDDERYLGWVKQYGEQVETPQPSDVALFKFGRVTSHAGIVVDDDLMVHAEIRARAVIKSEILRAPIYARHLTGFWRVKS